MTRAIILYCPMTGLGRVDRGQRWLKNRIAIFKQYVLKSLMVQSDKRFVIWVSWRPQDRYNPIVSELLGTMNAFDGLRTVFTYDGLCFYDDKYPKDEAELKLLQNLRLSLPVVKPYVDFADEVLMVIQPSDDMYNSEMVKTFNDLDFKDNKVAGYRRGYIIDYATKQVAEYDPDTIPPFFAIRFPKDVFLTPFEHYKWTGPYVSHEYVGPLGYLSLPGRGFCVGTHGANISTTFDTYRGKFVSNSVLLKFGVYFNDPIKLKSSHRIILRRIYNRLPFKSLIKKIYDRFKQSSK